MAPMILLIFIGIVLPGNLPATSHDCQAGNRFPCRATILFFNWFCFDRTASE